MPWLKVERVSKRFGRVQALQTVSLILEQGRIYGLAGENGAGKSTLVKLLCGVHSPDEGHFEWEGQSFAPANPAEAEEAGVSVFHQEIPVCPNLSVAANVFLGQRIRGVFPDWPRLQRQCTEWFDQWLGMGGIDTCRLLRDCTVVERQMTLLVRVLSRQARLIILDEPTTALTPPETSRFFQMIRHLSSQGITFLFISHFLHELIELSDHIYVLRDGRLAGSLEKSEFDVNSLARLIAGHTVETVSAPSGQRVSSPPKLEVRSLSRIGLCCDVSFRVYPGEIVGITGLQGSGRSAVARALFGAPPAESGEIFVDGKRVRVETPRDAMRAGIAYVPEDRQELGLFDDLDVQCNLGILRLDEFAKAGMLQRKRLAAWTQEMQTKLLIDLPAPDAPITSLSGGNQQKVLIARWLAVQPKVLVLNEPTRGVDIGAKDEICRLLRGLAENGGCLVVVSSDLDEVLRLSDRVLVMAGGRVSREFSRSQVNKAQLIEAVGSSGL